MRPSGCAALLLLELGSGLRVHTARQGPMSGPGETQPVYCATLEGSNSEGPAPKQILKVDSRPEYSCSLSLGLSQRLGKAHSDSRSKPTLRHDPCVVDWVPSPDRRMRSLLRLPRRITISLRLLLAILSVFRMYFPSMMEGM